MESIEYICTYCGRKEKRAKSSDRPQPGNCPRKPKTKEGKMQPHSWRINRHFP